MAALGQGTSPVSALTPWVLVWDKSVQRASLYSVGRRSRMGLCLASLSTGPE